jgi:hypothetical protein
MSDPTDRPLTRDASDTPPRPGADGIRWELVDRMRRLIAEGKLDTPERWAVVEEMLFRVTEEGR